MKIVLSGIETNNKGAELMLYAILQQIEKVHPNAEVFVPDFAIKQGIGYIQTSVCLKHKPYFSLKLLARRLHVPGIMRHLHLSSSSLLDSYIVKGADYFIDASGFTISDQCNLSFEHVTLCEQNLKSYHSQGTNIIFLPQAFGPVEKKETQKMIACLNKYSNLIMPREIVSMRYLRLCNVPLDKIRLFPDFTSLVAGVFPNKYMHLKGAICIIPNMRMIDKGTIGMDEYLRILTSIIVRAKEMGKTVYLLNHEGRGDEELAYKCKKMLNDSIEVVTGLNALEVKGLIATSYLCVTSRFHGVASALNSCVPCLATSWSHKYEELFKDYELSNCLLDLKDENKALERVFEYLDTKINESVRNHLKKITPKIKGRSEEMWKLVWNV